MSRHTTDDDSGWALEDDEPPSALTPLTALETVCRSIVEHLHDEAVQLATDCMTSLLQAREAHPDGARGSVGVRVRRSPAPRAAPGVFVIEWFRVRGQQRTDYIARGSGPRYPQRAFGRLAPWEQALIETYEPRFAEIRALLHQLATLRRQTRQLADSLARRGGRSDR